MGGVTVATWVGKDKGKKMRADKGMNLLFIEHAMAWFSRPFDKAPLRAHLRAVTDIKISR